MLAAVGSFLRASADETIDIRRRDAIRPTRRMRSSAGLRCGGDQRNGDSATMLVLEYDASAARTIRHKVARQGAACQLVPPFETQSLRASVIARR